jgi:hypothetical protein
MYLVNTEPYICFFVNILSQFMFETRQVHWIATKHVLRYLRGTLEYGLRYLGGYGVALHEYTDLYWVGSVVDINSNSR